MLRKHVAFEIKELDTETGVMEGYASVFGVKDHGGDIVESGAFTKSLEKRNGKVTLRADHERRLVGRLGYVEAKEDKTGLFFKAHYNLRKQFAVDVLSDVKQALEADMPMGMSFGYDIIDSDYDKKTSTLHLNELELFEVSVTDFPMNSDAGVLTAKSVLNMRPEEVRALIKQLEGFLEKEPITTLGATERDAIASLESLTAQVRAIA